MKLSLKELERLAVFFRAFSETTRLALLQELKSGPRSVGELVDILPCTQANISKQLQVLHHAGLLSRERHGTSVVYAICEPMVMELCKLACEKLNQEVDRKRLVF